MDLKDFNAVEGFIKKRESRLRFRGAAPSSGKGPDAMVYGVSAPEAPVPPPGFAATAPESPDLDPWAGAATDPWASAAPPAQTLQPEIDAWDLDAFGMSKCKGGNGDARGPLQCYNCLGKGQPQFLCPSGKEAGQAGQGPACPHCKGKGHGTEACTNKGGGKYQPALDKGKGAISTARARGAKEREKAKARARSPKLMSPDGNGIGPPSSSSSCSS